jgi:hypothetical protein
MTATQHNGDVSATEADQPLTPFQMQLGGEDMGRFHQKDSFLGKVFETTRQFLMLKPTNSVRIVLKLDLEDPLAQKYPVGLQAIVRMRISRVAAPTNHLRFEWRLASATTEDVNAHVQANSIDTPFAGGDRDGTTAIGFLGKQFGHAVPGWRWHFPHVRKIEATLSLREPLGVLAIMRGCSDQVVWHPRGVVDPSKSLQLVLDDPALMEP